MRNIFCVKVKILMFDCGNFSIKVFDSRYDIENNEEVAENTVAERQISTIVNTVCISHNEYYGLMTAIVFLAVLLVSITTLTIVIYS